MKRLLFVLALIGCKDQALISAHEECKANVQKAMAAMTQTNNELEQRNKVTASRRQRCFTWAKQKVVKEKHADLEQLINLINSKTDPSIEGACLINTAFGMMQQHAEFYDQVFKDIQILDRDLKIVDPLNAIRNVRRMMRIIASEMEKKGYKSPGSELGPESKQFGEEAARIFAALDIGGPLN